MIIGEMFLRLKVREEKLRVAMPNEDAYMCHIEFNDDGRLFINGDMAMATKEPENEDITIRDDLLKT